MERKGFQMQTNISTWTELRIEIDKCIKDDNLQIKPLNIAKWNEIEHKIINHFTGLNNGFTWMWENNILNKFDHYTKEISDFSILSKILLEIIDKNELIWLFLEDNLNLQSKYWGYTGKINDIVKLLGELPLYDFYIISKKLKWIIGQNHEDIVFSYGEIAKELKIYFTNEQ
ncbi:MAG: hypothetical protein LBT84_03140 [Spirochaetia bacterium]|nr:hypothetical protein [Spirochaetia bacterium]